MRSVFHGRPWCGQYRKNRDVFLCGEWFQLYRRCFLRWCRPNYLFEISFEFILPILYWNFFSFFIENSLILFFKFTDFEFQGFKNLSRNEVKLASVMNLNIRVGISDGSGIMSNNIRNFVRANFLSLDFAQFELKKKLIQRVLNILL